MNAEEGVYCQGYGLGLLLVMRAFFGSIPEDFANRGESTVTKSPTMRKNQWKNMLPLCTSDGVFVLFFRGRNRGMARRNLPREFAFETKW